MRLLDGDWWFSASDLRRFSQCAHAAELDRLVALGELAAPVRVNELAQLLARHGMEHERAHLARRRAPGETVSEIQADTRSRAGLAKGHQGPWRRCAPASTSSTRGC